MFARETCKPRLWPRHRLQRQAGNLMMWLLLSARLASAQTLAPPPLPMLPQAPQAAAATPAHTGSASAPHELIVVIERSSSGRGWRFRRALRFAEGALAELTTQDRFNVVVYAASTEVLYARPAPAAVANLAEARSWLAGLDAERGDAGFATALEYALRVPGEPGYQRRVLLADATSPRRRALMQALAAQTASSGDAP